MAGGGASAGAAVAAPPVPGTISTVAGGVGGPARATNVPIADACGVSVANGLLYIADNTTVRQVDSTDRLTTPAGTEAGAPLGDGGPAASASVGTCATAVDHSGNLVIADAGNDRIRVVAAHNGTFYGQAMTAKDIYTVAGNGTSGYAGDGGPATGAQLSNPAGLAVDGSGNLGRRPGHQRRTQRARGRDHRPGRRRADLRHRQRPGTGGSRLTLRPVAGDAPVAGQRAARALNRPARVCSSDGPIHGEASSDMPCRARLG